MQWWVLVVPKIAVAISAATVALAFAVGLLFLL